MDGSDYPLLSKYGDPQCHLLNMLAEEATKLCDEDQERIPRIKIKFNLNPKQIVKKGANDYEALKTHGLLEEEPSKKTINLGSKKPIKFMASAFEEGATSKAESNFKEDDVLEQEWVHSESSKEKQNKSVGNSINKRKQLKEVEAVPPSELPQEFKDKINEMGGNEITLVITKRLFATDMAVNNNRLSMPLNQIKNVGFLREGELKDLGKKKGIEVTLIQPSLELTYITLAKWDMPKKLGPTISNYVLRSSWMKVALANQLKEDDKVEVWSFRVQEELHMALVKV